MILLFFKLNNSINKSFFYVYLKKNCNCFRDNEKDNTSLIKIFKINYKII